MKRKSVRQLLIMCMGVSLMASAPQRIFAANENQTQEQVVNKDKQAEDYIPFFEEVEPPCYFANGRFHVPVSFFKEQLPKFGLGATIEVKDEGIVDNNYNFSFQVDGEDVGAILKLYDYKEEDNSFKDLEITFSESDAKKVKGIIIGLIGCCKESSMTPEQVLVFYSEIINDIGNAHDKNGLVYTMQYQNGNASFKITSKNDNQPEQTSESTKALVEFKDVTTVRIVQQTLNELGYNCGNPDGVAGQNTTQAITSYQTEKGITVNGLVTDELLESLGIVEKVQKAVAAEGAKNEYGSNYTYDQLARNPDTYIGSKIKINGKVLQTGEDGDLCYARIAMNSNYDTVVFVIYEKDLLGYKLLDDDIVTVYGTSLGEYSYEAVSGATITIPCLNGDIIEM